jgi:hypothetical protein
MSKTFAQSKDEVAKLCRYFANNRQSFHAQGVKEAHIRQSLIDPFFEALGWDMRNAAMVAPQYREVITEDSLDIEGQQKAPDYTFRVGTLAKFYVEAKKCGVNINIDMGPAYQLRRYGFSARLALSILTDFEELGVYDCASRPRPNDKASHGRIQYYGFAEYPDRWREIWDVFSREAVWSGTFDQYAASKRKRGTSEVDSEFLKDIEGWRDVLARNLAIRISDLSADDLNAAVQKIIDRIIFLRMAEDRGLESYGQLHKLCEQPDIYNRFMSGLCQKADQKYNSGLFHFEKEPGVSEAPDSLTPDLTVDDNVLKPILQSLYFEHGCPYHFGVLPVEILGTVYERFLGKVIRLTAGHQAKVEEKPEVRKAGGVYYTPAYIVNYIVLNTVGKQVEGKSPADLSGSKTKPPFRVLDMACGSGSFLLGAYQFLLDHCLQWHQANPSKKHAGAVYQNAKGETRLTIAERKRILITHIFGVDIDRQAVETTKLSLLLKALEGENDSSLSQQMSLFHERALPNLSYNIKCGNSLIASDFSMHPEDLVRVNAFDWPAQFPDAMKAGGFDAIIGNPPYVLLSPDIIDGQTIEYLRRYEVAQYKTDLFHLFIQKGIVLARENGLFGMIVPNTWLTLQFTDRLRRYIVESTTISEVVMFDHLVFEHANVFTALLFVEKQNPAPTNKIAIRKVMEAYSAKDIAEVPVNNVMQSFWKDSEGCIFETRLTGVEGKFVQRLIKNFPSLESVARASLGCQAYNSSKHTKEQIENRVFHADHKKGKDYLPELAGNDIGRYIINRVRGQWIKYGPWLHDYRTMDWLEGPRILIREISGPKPHSLFAVYIEASYCNYKTILNVNPSNKTTFSMKYLLGILNSRLISFLYPFVSNKLVAQAFPRLSVGDIKRLPIAAVDMKNLVEKSRYDKLVGLVDKMLSLTPKLREATSESEKAALQNAITTTDAEIDRMVYKLYGLTEGEIKIVEDGTGK